MVGQTNDGAFQAYQNTKLAGSTLQKQQSWHFLFMPAFTLTYTRGCQEIWPEPYIKNLQDCLIFGIISHSIQPGPLLSENSHIK